MATNKYWSVQRYLKDGKQVRYRLIRGSGDQMEIYPFDFACIEDAEFAQDRQNECEQYESDFAEMIADFDRNLPDYDPVTIPFEDIHLNLDTLEVSK